MYHEEAFGKKLPIDPEGLLSTIPSIAHVLIGFWAGMKMMEAKDINMRVNRLFIIGAILMFIGFLFYYGKIYPNLHHTKKCNEQCCV